MDLLSSITQFAPATKRKFRIAPLLQAGIPPESSPTKDFLLTTGLVVGGQLILVSAAIHFALWIILYRAVPIIGELFIAQGIAGLVIGTAIIAMRKLPAVIAGIGYMVASMGGLVASSVGNGLFGFQDGFNAPWAKLTFALEAIGFVLLAVVALSLLTSVRRTTDKSSRRRTR